MQSKLHGLVDADALAFCRCHTREPVAEGVAFQLPEFRLGVFNRFALGNTATNLLIEVG
jgi:hypothetical protein